MKCESKPRQLLSIKEARERTKLAESTIRKKLCYGEWPYVKLGRRTLLDGDFIDQLIEAGYHDATAVAAK